MLPCNITVVYIVSSQPRTSLNTQVLTPSWRVSAARCPSVPSKDGGHVLVVYVGELLTHVSNRKQIIVGIFKLLLEISHQISANDSRLPALKEILLVQTSPPFERQNIKQRQFFSASPAGAKMMLTLVFLCFAFPLSNYGALLRATYLSAGFPRRPQVDMNSDNSQHLTCFP